MIGSFTTAPKLVIPSEWTRFEFTATLPSGSASTGLEITDPAIVGDEVLVWGWQVEQQSYATSYIPTNGTAITRAAETATGSGDAATFNDSEGVLMAEISALANDGTYRYISISSGALTNRIMFGYSNPSNSIRAFVTATTQQAFIESTSYDTTNLNKLALKYKVNDIALWINGFEVGVDTICRSTFPGITL